MQRVMRIPFGLAVAVLALSGSARAQGQARFANLREALQSGGALSGGNGPRNVNWIDGGRRYSYIQQAEGGEQIRLFDPAA